VLAYACGAREDHVFLELKTLLEPFGITRFYIDGWGAYRRHLDATVHTVGKRHTQKIERKHTTLRARIKRLTRKTICCSRSMLMHDLILRLFIHCYEFGCAVLKSLPTKLKHHQLRRVQSMPSSLWYISSFVVALLLSTANAEDNPDFRNRYQDQLHVQRAENWLQNKIRISLTFPYLDYAYQLIDSNRVSEARAELAAAMAVDPRDPQARLTYVILLHRFNEALRHFQTAVALEAHNDDYALVLASSPKETQQSDAALRLFGTALGRAPEDISLYKELAYLHPHMGHNGAAAHQFQQGIDQALHALQFAEEDTRTLERDIEQMRSEVQRLTRRFDLTLYQAWHSNTQQVRTSPSVFGQGVIPSQGGLELAYQPPGIGLRDERIFQILGRFLWSTEPRSLNVDVDSLQGSVGVRYKPFKQVNAYVSAERLFKIGSQAENNWLLRVTSGWDQGTRLKIGESLWPYSLLYGDLGYFVEHSSRVAFYGEARQGLALKVGNAVMLTPHLVLDGRYQTLNPNRNAYLEGGLGASLKYFFNPTRYETPRSSLELLIQYKIGLIESASGWVVTGILSL
jgi:IS1 family transposase/tetratricopeptide (TPR) repeat protein